MSDWKGPEMDGDPPLEAVREQRVGVRTALDGLERALAAPSVGRAKEWCAAVGERADALSDAFAIHVPSRRWGIVTSLFASTFMRLAPAGRFPQRSRAAR